MTSSDLVVFVVVAATNGSFTSGATREYLNVFADKEAAETYAAEQQKDFDADVQEAIADGENADEITYFFVEVLAQEIKATEGSR